MTNDGFFRVWTQIGKHAQGSSVSVAHLCATAMAVAGVDGVGVSLVAGPEALEAFTTTDVVAARIEELQLVLGEGPAADASAEGRPVLAVDLATAACAERWPAFAPAALAAGARAVIALPLQIGAIRLGVFTLYRVRPGGLSALELADALVIADTVCMLLLDHAAVAGPDATGLAWRDGLPGSDAVVHQATGMILVQLGVTAEVAFVRLRAYAYAQDRRLGDVARDVVARRLRFDPDQNPGAGVGEPV
ncbi:GAF domain-containing protein [Pilimelia terevasa]|uniref:GAF domain-containing protein n=1 Tax=Pilimelia terevasa TaxID=53372 RepID=A0A8J3BV13_9ACTN|nr:GAF and ANTAR domain-containing protein [Pilimelia terevasa]GGK43572.1 GAF domain-containing protein [Pilimelia terevasa]